MVLSSSKSTFRQTLGDIHSEIQATDLSGLDTSEVEARIR